MPMLKADGRRIHVLGQDENARGNRNTTLLQKKAGHIMMLLLPVSLPIGPCSERRVRKRYALERKR